MCNTGCSAPDADTCRPLKSVSVGATGVSSYPTAASDACGPSFGVDSLGSLASSGPETPEHCEALYLTADKAQASLAEVCADGCRVLYELDNGVKASATIDAAAPAQASPSPEPETSPSPSSSPSGPKPTPTPKPYGPTPYRRRSLMEQEELKPMARRVVGRRL